MAKKDGFLFLFFEKENYVNCKIKGLDKEGVHTELIIKRPGHQ